ncbi:MAG: stage 0 sporulation family protein [Bacilli bacterium]|nr:stage 0 sporulation family protein [Bacilli bacterium]
MKDTVGVEFKENGEISYFLIENIKPRKNVTVIVETDRGLQFGKVVTEITQKNEKELDNKGKKVIRISTKTDYHTHLKNKEDEKEALKTCKQIVVKKDMRMQMLDANYNFDRSQLMFRFVADNRVDFRELAKELASIYRTRIELRQIGIRDKAKEVGGMGLCGRPMCCSRFLKDFDSVSISMAKNQNISLNPNKINGVCGRLLCCLKYEDECYSNCKKCLPKEGSIAKTPEGQGKVISVDVLNKKYLVEIPGYGILEMTK